MMNVLKTNAVNAGLKIGLGLMKIPAATIGGIWKTFLRVTIVLAETIRETIGNIIDILRELQE